MSIALRDVGWVWEGQGLDPGVHPSIFGIGEGAKWFGLRRVHFLFHPNTELAMEKLRGLDDVVCDISKWKFKHTEKGGSICYCDPSFETVRDEAANVSRLSRKFPNITGAIHDDMKGLIERAGISGDRYSDIYGALKKDNPKLKLWSVAYTHELDPRVWKPFLPFMDVVNLWVWNAKDLPKLDEGVAKTRDIFGDKPIVVGCYLRDYTTRAAVPMDMLKHQWERVAALVAEKKIAGYAILASVLIDVHETEARWVRDFIARH